MKKSSPNNLRTWWHKVKTEGKAPSVYLPFEENEDLAELIGVVLGDGHIEKFPRCERLVILSHSDDEGFIERYSALVEKIFNKKPTVFKRKTEKCVQISLYQKEISSRLGIPTGAKLHKEIKVPDWILLKKRCILSYLRGLYEADGCFSVHKPSSTYKLFFSNDNQSLLKNVYNLLIELGFHPHIRNCDVQISRKKEVYELIELLQFRKY